MHLLITFKTPAPQNRIHLTCNFSCPEVMIILFIADKQMKQEVAMVLI